MRYYIKMQYGEGNIMNLSPVILKKVKDTADRILHVPGNFTGPVLEMAVVIDGNLSREQVTEYVPELFRILKMHSRVFQNVRLNIVYWRADGDIKSKVSPMSMALLSSFYEDYEQVCGDKTFEELADYLKMYQARAKLIILLTDGTYHVKEEELLEQRMRPFLDKKLMQIVLRDGELDVRYRFRRTV